MNTKIGWFAGYYQQAWSNRPSGANDENVLATSIGKYTKKRGKLPYMKPYEILRKCEKWKPEPNEVSKTKRSKTSASGSYGGGGGGSEARCAININDKLEFEDEAPTPESEHPIGRDWAKKATDAKASSSKRTTSSDV
ncbi:uncharacterized protein LOC110869554 [Helianthus annuus]|uniref:uncharacterized protein LOC110869554 n=1 Tax=Helianthus annuus TaxID=4232 RepID=UPI000B8FF107|nr:uncharacterized protein LOC110869554 [Helianthus annuus]